MSEERVDGRELRPLREPGSDERLSDEAKTRIAEVVAEQAAARTRDRDHSA
jgi:hypothetical protein